MFTKVLIANRGAIACRVIRTLRRMGIASVAVYSDADADSLHVREADEAVALGDPVAARSYLDRAKILAAARSTGAQAIHPGYGFLSENAAFAAECAAAGITFIGPSPDHMRAFGLKHEARRLAEEAGVPMLPGTALLTSEDEAVTAAATIGYPVMLKSTAGGGGIGMQLCRDDAALRECYASVSRMGAANFGDGGVFLERAVESARHIEVQIFGDGAGNVLALTERDCSTQRRNQKVIEETPAPGLTAETRAALLECARRLGESIGYASAGTVEFLYDDARGEFYFLEVNTRLQVEHGVTEEIHNIDLVEWMIRQAAGGFTLPALPPACGHSIQVRLYAEDPHQNFRPGTGLLTSVTLPDSLRCESWIGRGIEVTGYYDPMLAKLIARGPDRATALTNLQAGLAQTGIHGIETNLAYLRAILAAPEFAAGAVTTRYLNTFAWQPDSIDVLDAGLECLIVDYPGRTGYWHIGVPPSGPMDALHFRLANRIVGNAEGETGLEITAAGPTLQFNSDRVIALAGADMQAELDGVPVPRLTAIPVTAGQVLRMKGVRGPGQRAHLAIRGGLDVPEFLGSRTTFRLGRFGGHGGRQLLPGDVLHPGHTVSQDPATDVPDGLAPEMSDEWCLRVLYGPHGAPDFFTPDDIATFFATSWEVHYNSARTGVRLIGPRPQWARKDGGEAGLHPSNIHDNAYSIGAVDFTGDMPVILGPDGPSLGGFVCPVTIITADQWMMGQLRPGARVRFLPVHPDDAIALERAQTESVATLTPATEPGPQTLSGYGEAILLTAPEISERPAIKIRQSGDHAILVEYGPMVLDLNLRFRVHALMSALQERDLPGLAELTPGIRSLQIRYDGRTLTRTALLDLLPEIEASLPAIHEMEVPARIVHMPLSWDDPSTRLAIEKYVQSVRKDAPWCPSNIEFIRRINGLESIDEVLRTVFEASYLVLGLGDVYLGAPVATPLDPRHRLVTTKYNPARTWTPENAVGIGGAYLCVYGMEGPGGYQFVGRTVPVWNRFRTTPDFQPGKPWLLRFFDQIKFYPVSEAELLELRRDLISGTFTLRIEETTFRLADYQKFLTEHAESIARFQTTREAAFSAERDRWDAAGLNTVDAVEPPPPEDDSAEIPEGSQAVLSGMAGNVWKVLKAPGDPVTAGETVLILESMKMEISIAAPGTGTITAVFTTPDTPVRPGQPLFAIREKAGHE